MLVTGEDGVRQMKTAGPDGRAVHRLLAGRIDAARHTPFRRRQ